MQTCSAPAAHPVCISWQLWDRCLERPLWSGGLTLSLYLAWLQPVPAPASPGPRAHRGSLQDGVCRSNDVS